MYLLSFTVRNSATVMLNWLWFMIFARNAAIVIHFAAMKPNTLTPNRRSVA